uniref:SHSP domain-containing protein n=1 Tax=Plectus sambesii TaxID=2011161 RepID=A0A914WAC9_9BILA
MGDSVPLGHDWTGAQWDWPLQHNDGVVKMVNHKDLFEVWFDCQFFTPKEIEVKVNGDHLVIHARHEARNDAHGEVAREVNRTYKLPSDVDTKSIKSHLNGRGVLSVTANKK